MRVQVNLSEKMVERVDRIAEDMGLSRSAVCNMLIGQGVNSYEKANNIIANLPQEAIVKALEQNK